MKSRTNGYVFWGLYVVSWLIFVGLSIEAGALLVNFFYALYDPIFISKLYQKLDLMDMYNASSMCFYGVYSFILVISILKAWMFYIVIRLMHKMDLSHPFQAFVSNQISYISYFTLAIGLLSAVARQIVKSLSHYGFETKDLDRFWVDSDAFILMGAVIYIIAVIFKKGVEIQSENELTV